MAHWKASVKLLLSAIELPFLSLAVEALQGKRCQDSLLSGGGRSVRAKISGGMGRPWGLFFGFYKTRHILLSNSANCTVIRAVVLTQYWRVTDGQTDKQTDGQTDRRTDRRNCRSWYSACKAARCKKSFSTMNQLGICSCNCNCNSEHETWFYYRATQLC